MGIPPKTHPPVLPPLRNQKHPSQSSSKPRCRCPLRRCSWSWASEGAHLVLQRRAPPNCGFFRWASRKIPPEKWAPSEKESLPHGFEPEMVDVFFGDSCPPTAFGVGPLLKFMPPKWRGPTKLRVLLCFPLNQPQEGSPQRSTLQAEAAVNSGVSCLLATFDEPVTPNQLVSGSTADQRQQCADQSCFRSKWQVILRRFGFSLTYPLACNLRKMRTSFFFCTSRGGLPSCVGALRCADSRDVSPLDLLQSRAGGPKTAAEFSVRRVECRVFWGMPTSQETQNGEVGLGFDALVRG